MSLADPSKAKHGRNHGLSGDIRSMSFRTIGNERNYDMLYPQKDSGSQRTEILRSVCLSCQVWIGTLLASICPAFLPINLMLKGV